jgi:hypothetical protein
LPQPRRGAVARLNVAPAAAGGRTLPQPRRQEPNVGAAPAAATAVATLDAPFSRRGARGGKPRRAVLLEPRHSTRPRQRPSTRPRQRPLMRHTLGAASAAHGRGYPLTCTFPSPALGRGIRRNGCGYFSVAPHLGAAFVAKQAAALRMAHATSPQIIATSSRALHACYPIPTSTPSETDEARRRGGHGQRKGHAIHGACTC